MTEPGPSTLAARKEELLRLADGLDRLPECERDALIAHYVLGLPLSEVADRLGRSAKGAAGLLFRGKLRLRTLMGRGDDA